MASSLPTPSKTWDFSQTNQQIAQVGTGVLAPNIDDHNRDVFLTLKDSLLAVPIPCVVLGSSNSVTAGMDAVDRLAARADLVWAAAGGNPHTWIVLSFPGISATYQVLFDFINVLNTSEITTYVSPVDGFTGGDSSNRPTATDEINIYSAPMPFRPHTDPLRSWVHVVQSTDGEITRWYLCQSGCVVGVGNFELVGDTNANWTDNWVARCKGLPIDESAYSGFVESIMYDIIRAGEDPSNGNIGENAGTGLVAGDPILGQIQFTGEALMFEYYGGSVYKDTRVTDRAVYSGYSSVDSALPVTDVRVIYRETQSTPNLTNITLLGRMVDMWWAPDRTASGDSFPENAATRNFTVTGSYLIPWRGDGTKMETW